VTQTTRSRDLRVKATFRVRYRSMDDLVIAFSTNLSRGGLFLATKKQLPQGSILRLNIELPDGGAEITVPCEVAYVRSADDAQGRSAGMGIKFIDPDEVARRRLEWFILNSAPEPGQFGALGRARALDVLIVEDDKLQSEVTAAPFQQRGDKVHISRDGLEGLASALKSKPDVILSDVQMPKMDGWQLLRMIRSRPALAHVPFIFLTTLSGEEDRLRGYRLGVDDYLPKPFEPSELLVRADRAVVRAEQQAQASDPPEPEALQGDLEQVSLQSMLAFLEVERKTGVLRVGPVTNGRILIQAGRPIRVELHDSPEDSSPKDRLFTLLSLTVGRFDFHPGPVSGTDELGTTSTALMLEYAKHCDDRDRG
jgi:uncharacterized protein (TIGR02266 family)